MFINCYSLLEIVFPEVKARELETTEEMFKGCANLKTINLEGLNTNSIKDINYMFKECKNLQEEQYMLKIFLKVYQKK